MADDSGGGPQILEALLKTDSASSWNQDKLADFGKKTRKEARALVKGGGGAAGGGGGDEIDTMDTDEVMGLGVYLVYDTLLGPAVAIRLLTGYTVFFFAEFHNSEACLVTMDHR